MQDEADQWMEPGSMESTSSESGGCSFDEDEAVSILCELVGARHLAIHDDQDAGDLNNDSLRPFCVVKLGGRVIHTTKTAKDLGCNPIWTVSTRSLFVFKATPKELIRGLLNITLYSKKEKSLPARFLKPGHIFLGQVNLDSSAVLSHCDEQRFEAKIEDEIGEESSYMGTLALRLRIAAPSDQQIVRLFNLNSKLSQRNSRSKFVNLMLESSQASLFQKGGSRPLAKLITETDESEIAQSSLVNALNNVFTATTIRDKATGNKKVRIKPCSDPDRLEETKFMTPQEIHVETRSPSQKWVEAGSGRLGKLYVEILSCEDLPNVDVGEAVGNVTDSFVSLVYEDTCAMTDVIDDELSPHWLPWTQRAFCLSMMHPASILYLGVFDYDLGLGDHEPIGRVAVNVCNLQRNTVYTLKYNLYPSSNVTDRTANGSITIRIRVECDDEKAALLAALKPRPKIHVNVRKEKSFKVIRYTCFGQYDNEEKFDLTVTRSYINEIFEYKAAVSYFVGDSVRSLVFWRGQVKVFSVLLPLHSLLFFLMTAHLVEKPQMIVPFSLIGVGWAMLANLTIRQQHPSPWVCCPPFWHYLHLLRTGKSPTPVESIKELEGHEAAQAYELAWKNRIEEDRLVALKKAELQEEINAIGDDNIDTKMSVVGAIPLDLLVRLARYQGIVGRICKMFRFIKIIATWEESIVSFWITAGFLGAGLVSLVLPWSFILAWTGRIVVWGCFGPHMKLVDLAVRANQNKDGSLQKLVKNFDVQSNVARLRREEALKAKDVKEIAFGKYSIKVPSFNLARHCDRPLPESSARLCRKTPKRSMNRRISVVKLDKTPWIPGQQLYGDMIPRPEHEANFYKQEAIREEKHLVIFKDRVRREIDARGVKGLERLKLAKMGFDTDTPVAFGYEVVRQDETSKEEEAAAPRPEVPGYGKQDKKNITRLSVLMTVDADDVVDDCRSDQVVLENDGTSTYEVKRQGIEEEGLEVVGLGRYSTLAEELDVHQREILSTQSADSILQREDFRLSELYTSSEKVDVAFYRPMKNL